MAKRTRRPVRWRSACWDEDVQALPPRGWCLGCGMELYLPDAQLCEDCKEDAKNDKNDPEPL